MCPVIISTHISKMLSTAESQRPWRAKAAYPYMKAQGGGVILNASSFAALDPNAGRATYSAAKAAVKKSQRIHGVIVCCRQYPGAGLCAGYDRNRDRCGEH